MGTITLKNLRVNADVEMITTLEDGGVLIDWSTLTGIKVWLYSDAQKSMAGRCDVSIDPDDETKLICLYSASKPQYPGVNRLIVQATYMGELKTFDKPAFNFVRWTGDQEGEQITIDDPDVDVAIKVTDVSSSILQNAIAAALQAAEDAEHAAHLIPNQVLLDCEAATAVALTAASHAPQIGENGNWWVWNSEQEAYVDTGNVARGPRGNGITSWSVVESQEDDGNNVITVTFTDGEEETFTVKNGKTGNGIASIVQTVESPDDAGTNVITITMTNGTVVTFNVKNGSKGQPGAAQAAYKSVAELPTASAQTMDKIYLTPSGTANVYNMSYTDYDGTSYSWVDLGTTAIQLSDYATKAELGQLDLEVNGSTGDKDITPTMAQGYYYTVSGSTISVTNAATSWYSGDASTTPPTNGVDVSAYAGKTIKVVVTNRSGTSTRCCAVLNASNSVVKSWKESEFATDDAMYSYSFVVPSTGKWLFLSGSSTFALDSVVVVDGEVIIGLSDRMDNVENDIEGIDTEIEGIGTAIEGIQSDIEDAQDDISDLDTQINGGTSADTDVTPTTATGYYYLASGSTIKIMSAGTAHYSGIVTDTSTPPSGGLDVSSYVGKQIKIVVTSILGTSTRLTCILDAQMDVLASVEEQDFTLEDTKYVATLNVPIGAKWFFFSGSSVCILESVKVLGTEVPGLVDRVEDLENESETKSLKVLLLGSSFGVNTIVQFPALAIAGGIDCVCGNLYQGGVTLAGIVSIINGNGNFQNGRIYTKETNSWQVASKNIDTMLGLYKWDIIILQRAAPNKTGGSDTWTSSMASDLETIIQYIASHTTGSPKIMFNSVFGRSVGYFNGSRENQIASAELIMSTAREMQEQFGLEVIPAAVAIQNARNTSLSYVTTENTNNYEIPDLTGDGEHLDTGVGSYILGCLLYEQIIGKRFDKSILEMTTLPTLANVTGNGGFVDADFTQITASEARIARYAAMLAVREPWTINTALGELYPYPTT